MSSLLTGLKLYWNMQGNANDVSGNGNNATIDVNTTYSLANGKILQGVGFAGTGKLEVNSNILSINNPLSWCLWFKCPVGTGGTFPVAFIFANRTPPTWSVGYMVPSGDFFLNMLGGASIGVKVDDNLWHFCVMTYDGTTVNFWVDNVNKASYSGSGSLGPDQYVNVGHNNSAQFWNGEIDEVGIWQRALTASEVSLLWNSGNGITYPFSPPITDSPSFLLNLI
jgi:hypothetical protein